MTVACPECSSPLPQAGMLELWNWKKRPLWAFWRPKLALVKTGSRMCCQKCGHQFSIGPSGPFTHDPYKALPITSAPKPSTNSTQPIPEDTTPPRSPLRTPRERPPW